MNITLSFYRSSPIIANSPFYIISPIIYSTTIFYNPTLTIMFILHCKPVKIFVHIDFQGEQQLQTEPETSTTSQLQQHTDTKSRKRRRRPRHANDQHHNSPSKRIIKRQGKMKMISLLRCYRQKEMMSTTHQIYIKDCLN